MNNDEPKHHQKKEQTHIEIACKTLFNEFLSPNPGDRQMRHEIFKNVRSLPRGMKYLYAMAQMELPTLAYIWGIITVDERIELEMIRQEIQNRRVDNLLGSIDTAHLTHSQLLYLQKILDTAIKQGKVFFTEEDQRLFGLSKEELAHCNVTYDAVFKELLTDDKYIIDATGAPNDMYTNILKKFKFEYFEKLNEFQLIIDFINARYFGEQEIDLADFNTKTHLLNTYGANKLQTELDCTLGIINYFENRGIALPAIQKSMFYWQKVALGYFKKIAREIGELPPHDTFPEIGKNLKSSSEAFMTMFPHAKETDISVCRDLLLFYVREALKEQAIKDKTLSGALEWYDKNFAGHIQIHKLSPQQQAYEKEIAKKVKTLTLFEKMLANNPNIPLTKVNTLDYSSVSEESLAKSEHTNSPTELQQVLKELEKLKERYLADDERTQYKANRATFSFMSDDELLYMMGVFNQEEYLLCSAHKTRWLQQGNQHALREQSISEIFDQLLSDESIPALPLKKEYLDTMEQIRLASRLYQALYTDNTPDTLDLLSAHPFENEYTDADTPLRREGLFLEDMIMLGRHLEGRKKPNQYLVKLVDSYWEESIGQLLNLPPYKGRPNVRQQMRDNLILFNLDPNMKKSERNRIYSFKNRRNMYVSLLSQFHYEICMEYDTNKANRLRALNAYGKYTIPFEKQLNITEKEILNRLLDKKIRDNTHTKQ